MSTRNNMISNDIMRAVMDYISENEKDKVPTKNFAKVGQALALIRNLLENHTKDEGSELISVSVAYEETDVSITITLPINWSFDKKALKLWKDLLRLADEMSHCAGTTDGEDGPLDDRLSFVIRKVFEE
ncbi:MAG: hypothetical protein IJ109_08900 [Firmicutes bacterium]|nr:hypothetical protein [Bacillota bacterium]